MSCADVRVAISAALDGEAPGLDSAAVDRHLERCAECRRFAARARSVHRTTRVRSAEVPPDLTDEILAAIERAGCTSAPRRRGSASRG